MENVSQLEVPEELRRWEPLLRKLLPNHNLTFSGLRLRDLGENYAERLGGLFRPSPAKQRQQLLDHQTRGSQDQGFLQSLCEDQDSPFTRLCITKLDERMTQEGLWACSVAIRDSIEQAGDTIQFGKENRMAVPRAPSMLQIFRRVIDKQSCAKDQDGSYPWSNFFEPHNLLSYTLKAYRDALLELSDVPPTSAMEHVPVGAAISRVDPLFDGQHAYHAKKTLAGQDKKQLTGMEDKVFQHAYDTWKLNKNRKRQRDEETETADKRQKLA